MTQQLTPFDPVPPVHDALVARLTADAHPVRRLWPPSVRLATWCGAVATVLAIAAIAGLRQDLATAFGRPVYVLEIVLLVAAAASAATAALLVAIPGRDASPAPFTATLLACLGAAAFALEPVAPGGTALAGVRCAACIAMFGLLPWVALLFAVGRGAPLGGRAAGTYAGAAAVLIGAAAVRLACPIDGHLHLLAWHVTPAIAWIALFSLAGASWLVRRRAPARA